MAPFSLHDLLPTELLRAAYEPLFQHLKADEAWESTVRTAARAGPVVYVLRSVSLVDLLGLQHLTTRLGLPRISFANDLGHWVRPRADSARASVEVCLRQCFARGDSAVLFLRHRPDVRERATVSHRGKSEDDAPLVALFSILSEGKTDLTLVPQTLVWTQRPSRLGFSAADVVFGHAESPGDLRAAAQFVLNYKNGVVRAGEPVSLSAFAAAHGGADTKGLVYTLLRRLERERRAILGPVQKPHDRVRDEVLRSPRLRSVIADLAGDDAEKRAEAQERARQMLTAMEAAPDTGVLRGLEMVADVLAEQVYTGIDVDKRGLQKVREAAKKGTVVFLPSHKSHVDYLLLSFVLRKNALQTPLVAAGDNLSFFPVGPLFRRAGAFFIRRKVKGDKLYAIVMDAYVRRLIRDGWALELFLEGGRSRTGKLLPPQVGLLNMVVDAALGVEGREVTFVPVSIGYERMMEEGAFAREASGYAKTQEDARALLELRRVLLEKYGRANVMFGDPIELSTLIAEGGGLVEVQKPPKRRALVSRLAHRVMHEINRVAAVTPGAVVALVLLSHAGRGLRHRDLAVRCERLILELRKRGSMLVPKLQASSETSIEDALHEALLLYVRAGIVLVHLPGDTLTKGPSKRASLVRGDDVVYRVPDEKRILLDYPKDTIVHLFVERALVAVASLGCDLPAEIADVEAKVRGLSRLFKYELTFRADGTFEDIFAGTLTAMVDDGELTRDGTRLALGPGHDGQDGRAWVSFYAAILRTFLESYLVAARATRLLSEGPLSEKELAARALRVGEHMFLGGEIERSEAVSQPVLETALLAFVDQKWLERREGKLVLSKPDLAIEAEVSKYLRRRSGELYA